VFAVPVLPESETFLARWSRRKSGQGDLSGAGKEARDLVGGTVTSVPSIEHQQSENCSRQCSQPDTDPSRDMLGLPSDLSRYVRDGISEVVQRAALRQLWLTDPVFGTSDGLDVYCGDYSCSPRTGRAAAMIRQAVDAGIAQRVAVRSTPDRSEAGFDPRPEAAAGGARPGNAGDTAEFTEYSKRAECAND
jgi:hypothetical protein